MHFWDQAFSCDGYKYGTEPNAFLAEQARPLKAPLDVLVPGDGEGRNGVWLAQQGHRVLSIDNSQVGLDKAQALAQKTGTALRTELADLAQWVPAPRSADLLVLVYLHLPSAIRQDAHRRLMQALRPQGLVIFEAFHPLQLQHSSGGPKDVNMLMTLDKLRQDFAGLTEVLAFEGETTLSEGPGHQGLAHVTRWVARQP